MSSVWFFARCCLGFENKHSLTVNSLRLISTSDVLVIMKWCIKNVWMASILTCNSLFDKTTGRMLHSLFHWYLLQILWPGIIYLLQMHTKGEMPYPCQHCGKYETVCLMMPLIFISYTTMRDRTRVLINLSFVMFCDIINGICSKHTKEPNWMYLTE